MTLTPLEQFYSNEKEMANTVYLKQPFEGKWHDFTWQQVGMTSLTKVILPDLLEKGHYG